MKPIKSSANNEVVFISAFSKSLVEQKEMVTRYWLKCISGCFEDNPSRNFNNCFEGFYLLLSVARQTEEIMRLAK